MNWKPNNIGIMEPARSHSSIIRNALMPSSVPKEWAVVRTINENAKICFSIAGPYLAIRLNGQWRLLGRITNTGVINRYLQGPLAQFHQAWQVGTPIDEPKIL